MDMILPLKPDSILGEKQEFIKQLGRIVREKALERYPHHEEKAKDFLDQIVEDSYSNSGEPTIKSQCLVRAFHGIDTFMA